MKRLLIAIIPVLTLSGCEETAEEKTGARQETVERLTGIECTARDPINFERAMRNLTTAPNYILVDAVDKNTGGNWVVCLESLEFLDVVGREQNIQFDQVAERALESIKDGNGSTFVLASPEAIELLKPGYTPETLVQLREKFRERSDEELVELFSVNRSKMLGSLCRELDLPLDGTTQRAVAHMLLERGILCGRGCLGGFLYIVPESRQRYEQRQKDLQRQGPDQAIEGGITGVLLGHDGRPVAGATVVLCEAESGIPLGKKTFKPFIEGKPDLEALAAVATDAGGKFRFGAIPAGTYRLVAQSWPEAPGVTKVLEKNGTEIILRGVANAIRVPSNEAEHIVIKPLGTGAVSLDENFPNSDALLVISSRPLSADPVLGFVSWQGPFLQNLLGANRMPKGITKIDDE